MNARISPDKRYVILGHGCEPNEKGYRRALFDGFFFEARTFARIYQADLQPNHRFFRGTVLDRENRGHLARRKGRYPNHFSVLLQPPLVVLSSLDRSDDSQACPGDVFWISSSTCESSVTIPTVLIIELKNVSHKHRCHYNIKKLLTYNLLKKNLNFLQPFIFFFQPPYQLQQQQ